MKKTLFDVFDDTFNRQLAASKSYPEAFERANERFEHEHGFSVSSVPGLATYDSYRMRRARRKKSTKSR